MSAVSPLVLGSELDETVTCSDGRIRGSPRDLHGVLSFKGIPYAAPPVGDLRWRSPRSPAPWTDVRDVQQFGSSAWSALEGVPSPTPQHEDCLTLNIWTVARHVNEKSPVMVWMHGGGFQFGSSADPTFDGTALAKEGVVLVSCNYRVGVFGFLALPELDGEGSPSGNFGLQDQIAALQWVRTNIASFGGDAHNVTVFGESAGAHAIGLLMSSPLADGLVHKAILQSGAYWDTHHGPLSTFDEARDRGTKFASQLGVNSVAELRSLAPAVINSAGLWDFTMDPSVSAFSPSIDGFVLPHAPAQSFAHGRQLKIPILAGWNAAEHSHFLPWALPHSSATAFRSAAQRIFGERAPEFLALYPATTDAEASTSAAALIGDLVIAQQTWDALDTQHYTTDCPVYAYYYTYASSYSPVAAHAAEQTFVFGTLLSSPSRPAATDQDRMFSRQLMAYWTNFAKQGNPNHPTGGKLPTWPPYGGGNGLDVMELGKTIAPIEYSLDRFRFLRSLRTDGVLPFSWRSLD